MPPPSTVTFNYAREIRAKLNRTNLALEAILEGMCPCSNIVLHSLLIAAAANLQEAATLNEQVIIANTIIEEDDLAEDDPE